MQKLLWLRDIKKSWHAIKVTYQRLAEAGHLLDTQNGYKLNPERLDEWIHQL